MAKRKLNRKRISPQDLYFTGVKYSDNTDIQYFEYDSAGFSEKSINDTSSFKGFVDPIKFHWLNINGIHDVEQISQICNKLNIHNLAIQDILDVDQRPKSQEFDDYWFFSIKSIIPSGLEESTPEQMSFILGSNFIVSFQEKKGNYFDHVRTQIRDNKGGLRERGADYLLFLLFESVMDNYFKVIDELEQVYDSYGKIDINEDPSPNILNIIDFYKRKLLKIKTTAIPLKEFVNKIERKNTVYVQKRHLKYYYELRDISLSLIDECNQLDSQLDSSINKYFSVQGYRMNQVMKTLAVVSTVFIPLTFLAGVYGMNFEFMPELHLKYGYLGVWIAFFGILVGMFVYFKKKNWF